MALPASASWLSTYRAVCAFVRSEQRVLGADHANIQATRDQQVGNMRCSFNNTTTTLDDARALLYALGDPDDAFTDDNRTALAQHVSAHMRAMSQSANHYATRSRVFTTNAFPVHVSD